MCTLTGCGWCARVPAGVDGLELEDALAGGDLRAAHIGLGAAAAAQMMRPPPQFASAEPSGDATTQPRSSRAVNAPASQWRRRAPPRRSDTSSNAQMPQHAGAGGELGMLGPC